MKSAARLTCAVLALAGLSACGEGGKSMFQLTSPAFKHKATIPKAYTCEGRDASPELHWSGQPAKTRSFSLIMDDPDAPMGTWVHWVLYDIPAGYASLPEDVPKQERVLESAKHGASWGIETFSRAGYGGPCPPPGKTHRYMFKLYALDVVLGLPARVTKEALLKAMKGHILAQSELIGTYKR